MCDLSIGGHPITASYSGIAYYLASSTSGASTQQVILPPNSTPVTIDTPAHLANGTLQLNFSGVPGYTYLIEAATSLTSPITWTILSTNVANVQGLFNFTDLSATNHADRYYRTVVQ